MMASVLAYPLILTQQDDANLACLLHLCSDAHHCANTMLWSIDWSRCGMGADLPVGLRVQASLDDAVAACCHLLLKQSTELVFAPEHVPFSKLVFLLAFHRIF